MSPKIGKNPVPAPEILAPPSRTPPGAPRSARKGSPSPAPLLTSQQQWPAPSPAKPKPRSSLAGLDSALSRVAQYAAPPAAPAASSLARELELLR